MATALSAKRFLPSLIPRIWLAAPAFFTALNAVSGGRMVPVAGGVLIKNNQNEIIGSIGISGDDSDNDEICAVSGVAAAGLIPDTGA